MRFKPAILAGIIIICSFSKVEAQTPTFQDCLGAIQFCADSFIVNFSHNGMGNFSNEIANVSTCYAPEQRSIWFEFTVIQAGILRFELNPTTTNQDHDWTLFNMTNVACSTLSTSTGAASAMVRSNTWGAWGFNGSTGVSTPNGGTGTCNGPGTTNGPKWCADLNVPAGNRYLLHISNWTGSSYGFTLDMSSSTAILGDTIPPYIDSISSSLECSSFDSLVVEFSEPMKCDSFHVGDFSLSGPSGYHTISSVTSPFCSGGADNTENITIHFTPPVTQIGQYTLQVEPGFGYIEDACGNLDTIDSVQFYFDGFVEPQFTTSDALCFGDCTGTIQTQVVGGTAPFSFNWSGSLDTTANHTGVCAGQYFMTLTDSAGCEIEDSLEIIEPTDHIPSIISPYGLSCPGVQICDGGAIGTASGGVPPYSYAWSNGETNDSATSLCADTNYVTVTDAHGCIDSAYVDIWRPDSIKSTGFGDTLICITNAAAISVASIGGTPPYSYVWTKTSLNGSFVSSNGTPTVYPETTTQYFVVSTDSNGCVGDSSEVLVKVRPPLGLDFPEVDTICPYDTIDILAVGLGGDSNYTYSWASGVFGEANTISPDEPTWYAVTVSDACGTPVYTDSVFVQVGGYSPLSSIIRLEDDSLCNGEITTLTASARGGHKGPVEYRYKWSHTPDSYPVQFIEPKKTTEYEVTISDLCLSEPDVAKVTVYVGNPEHPDLVFEPAEACAASEIMASVNVWNPKSRYTWYVDDEVIQSNYQYDSVTFKLTEVGCHEVSVGVRTAYGCHSLQKDKCGVKILVQPDARFDRRPAYPTNIEPHLSFFNTSINTDHITWYINTYDTLYDDVFLYEFDDYWDTNQVMLVAVSIDGCVDTVKYNLPYVEETLLYYPKSFTPNDDGLNEEFKISGEGMSSDGFDLIIHDRWGQQLFRANRPDRGWDGRSGDGRIVPVGTYPFTLQYTDHRGQVKVIRDQIIVSKSGIERGLR